MSGDEWRKQTQEINLDQTVEVPMPDGGTVAKRLLELTPEDLRRIAERHRAAEAEAAQRARDAAIARRGVPSPKERADGAPG